MIKVILIVLASLFVQASIQQQQYVSVSNVGHVEFYNVGSCFLGKFGTTDPHASSFSLTLSQYYVTVTHFYDEYCTQIAQYNQYQYNYDFNGTVFSIIYPNQIVLPKNTYNWEYRGGSNSQQCSGYVLNAGYYATGSCVNTDFFSGDSFGVYTCSPSQDTIVYGKFYSDEFCSKYVSGQTYTLPQYCNNSGNAISECTMPNSNSKIVRCHNDGLKRQPNSYIYGNVIKRFSYSSSSSTTYFDTMLNEDDTNEPIDHFQSTFEFKTDFEFPIYSSSIYNNNNNNGTTTTFKNNNSNNINSTFKTQTNFDVNKNTDSSSSSSQQPQKKIRITKKKNPDEILLVQNKKRNNNVNNDNNNNNQQSLNINSNNSNNLTNLTQNNNNNNIELQQKEQNIELKQSKKKEDKKTIIKTTTSTSIGEKIEYDDDNLDNDDSDLQYSLTEEQEKIVNLIVQGEKNVFFTGSAGTGKSFILKHLVNRLRKKYPKSVFVTAATGIAAVNIGGVTLHSFAGIKLGVGTAQKLAVEILQSKKSCQKWLEAKVLIIDEVSMIDAELFEKLDSIGKLVRGNNLPFGGIQLVLLGDFFQLPPVYGNYAFESRAWKKCIDLSLELTTVMRQKDETFIKILNGIRVGLVSEDTVNILDKCSKPLDITNGILPTKLYATNAHVDDENNLELQSLKGEATEFIAVDSGHKDLIALLDKDCPAPQKLVLKVGAQVVLLRKLPNNPSLVNGSRGVVVGFVKNRAKSKHKNWIGTNTHLPVVLFNDGQKVTVPPSEFGVWNENKAFRTQLPLKLAWALTIHRAQGMTLDKVECKLSETFAPGQAYVALSRVKTLEGLYLKEFAKKSIKTSSKDQIYLFVTIPKKDKTINLDNNNNNDNLIENNNNSSSTNNNNNGTTTTNIDSIENNSEMINSTTNINNDNNNDTTSTAENNTEQSTNSTTNSPTITNSTIQTVHF
eukprot:gene5078-6321_t